MIKLYHDLGEISVSCSGENEDGCFLGCCTMLSGRSLSTIQMFAVSVIKAIITIIALMMEAVSTFETSVKLYQSTRCNIPKDSHLLYNDPFVAEVIYDFRIRQHLKKCESRFFVEYSSVERG
jgi:hypothetical protein